MEAGSGGWEATVITNFLLAGGGGGSDVWEAAAIISSHHVLLVADVDVFGGDVVVWRARDIVSNIVVRAAEGSGGSVWRAAYINDIVVMKLANDGNIIF